MIVVSQIQDWRLTGCDDRCRPRQHDPEAHEAYGRLMVAPLVVTTGPLAIDLTASTAALHGAPLRLTRLEWAILAHLARRRNQAVSHDDLIAAVWGRAAVQPSLVYRNGHHTERMDHRMLRVRVNSLRRKLGADADLVTLTRGIGYRLEMLP